MQSKTVTLRWLNCACFFAGMIGAWFLTHDWRVLLCAFVASLHFSVTVREVQNPEQEGAFVRMGWPKGV